MTKVLIIEDEAPAIEKLSKQLNQLAPKWDIIATTDSISSSIAFLRQQTPDIIFMDIHLADGDSFEIFHKIDIHCPVVFTTAHSEYAIKAFKVNGLDYLLKPIPEQELNRVIQKFIKNSEVKNKLPINIQAILKQIQNKYKERFLIKMNHQLISIPVSEIAYFYSEDKLSFIKTKTGDRFPMDDSLDKIELLLDPVRYFRINRKTILHIEAINKIEPYFNSRLTLTILPSSGDKFIVSREKVKFFKAWLNR